MAFYFYFNHLNRKVKIHEGRCIFCNEGRGPHKSVAKENGGGWSGSSTTYEDIRTEAQAIAEEIAAVLTDCKHCKPRSLKE